MTSHDSEKVGLTVVEVDNSPGAGAMIMASLCLGAAPLLLGYAVSMAFNYTASDKLVGGDAYNMMIIASRATVVASCGVGVAVIGAIWMLLSLRAVQLANQKRS